MQVGTVGWEDPLEEGIATQCSILAWWTPWTEEPGKLQFMGSQRLRHDWSDLAHTHTNPQTHTHTCCSFEDGIFVPFWEVWAWRNLCDITKVTELLRTRSKNVLRGFKAFSPLCCAMSCPPIMWNQQAMTSMLSFSFHRSAKRETNRKMDHAEKQTRKIYSTADMARKGWCPHQSCHIPDAVPWWLQCWPQTACWDTVIFKPLVPVGALSLLPAASFSLGSSLLT